MGYLIDISVPLHSKLPVWPGNPPFKSERVMEQSKGDVATSSRIELNVHTGTHIDAPLHFVETGKTTEFIPLGDLTGPCRVVDLCGHKVITPALLDSLNLPSDTKKLLFKTDNSVLWNDPSHSFYEDYVALSPEGAEWIVKHGIRLVGIDYHSIQRFTDPVDTHVTLLQNEVVIVEVLDLRNVQPGPYKLWCLPLHVRGVEGIPARVVLEVV